MKSVGRQSPLILIALSVLLSLMTPAEGRADEPSGERELVIATRDAPPFAIKREKSWDGITIELIRRIADEEGFRVQFKEMGLDEMLDAVAAGEVDAAAAALTITAEREQRVDFTHPFFTSGLGVAVPQRPELTWFSALRRVASGAFLQSLAALLGVLTLLGALVWLAERRRNEQFSGKPAKGIGSGIWWSAVTMTTVGYGDKAPVTFAGRLIGLVWMFTSVVVVSSFTAAIASSLTVGELGQNVSGLSDLYGKRVVTAEDSTSARFLDQKLVRYRSVADVSEALDALAAGQADAVVYDLPILRHLVSSEHAGELRVLPGILLRQDYGIALPPETELRETVNRWILRMIQSPEWTPMIEGYLGHAG
ncbi:ABC transporter substrate-binding protein [Marichromatium purpuratum 984]|uniref:ABC transporter substrate-binding protein n=1 Tax=Marichromatium purpuratum 984 TaxID=765910 RepID=W0E578_MARPU|nr:transporter substrate-binding domain-containing protein [Marichromatium purpuratum]AHF04673.1 ABC transporter substrate-binding protein [Marichromatium purpuratum 984]